jgi:pSer/pThr/pTyr-binding forkhead associated (FHA) protein
MQIRLSWQDPATGDWRTPVLTPPITFGRSFDRMPAAIDGDRTSRIVLQGGRVSRFHAMITQEKQNLVLTDIGSRNGTLINGIRQTRTILVDGDTVQIDRYKVTISVVTQITNFNTASSNSSIFFNPNTDLPDPEVPEPPEVPKVRYSFPPPEFRHAFQLSRQTLDEIGLPVQEVDYLTIGAGLGSFIWVDVLRICGVKPDQIMALGLESQPYGRYQRLCENSQIPLHERLRSNSDSCPDNLWGWPGYAWREAWTVLQKKQWKTALKLLWQVFAEPTFAPTYTPRSQDVFAAIDREAQRIGWDQIYQYGRVRGIRKTNDGRYAIAYSRSSTQQREHGFLIAQYVHLATGYPAIQFLPDLQAYRDKTKDFKSVVNAYEPHQQVYDHLEKQGGTVVLRGRGIVASRILQRLYEARQLNRSIEIVHLMRSPKAEGHRLGSAERRVENHFEFQPFNWPKACWGGELKHRFEQGSATKRVQLLQAWGGTTTADRQDWRDIVHQGLQQGWYRIIFGTVESVEPHPHHNTLTLIREHGIDAQLRLSADFIIDATGLDADVQASPLLKDLVTHYNLPLNPLGRLSIQSDFELAEMRSLTTNLSSGKPSLSQADQPQIRGRMYGAGAITLGGPYAPVDSFLGLQYAALQSVQSLIQVQAPSLKSLGIYRSICQWLKWARNRSPD